MSKVNYVDIAQSAREVHYELYGSGSEHVLLIAGLGGVGTYWYPNLQGFLQRYTVLLHDHRGTGRSARSDIVYSVGQMTEDVITLMDQLGIERAHVVGHSTGGAMAQVMALDFPERVRSITLYASWTKADAFMRRIFSMRKALVAEGGVEAYHKATPILLYPDWWINANNGYLEEREKAVIANSPSAEILRRRMDAVLAFNEVERLEQITTPTFVICAKDDFLTPARHSEELASQIPGAKLELAKDGGHALSEVYPEQFNKSVLDFLAEL